MTEEITEEQYQQKLAEEAKKNNICTLQHPITRQIIMLTTSKEGDSATREKLLRKMCTNMEKQYFDEALPTPELREEALSMIPANFLPLEDYPDELQSAAKDQLEVYEGSTFMMMRMFEWYSAEELGEGATEGIYMPVLVDIKNKQFCAPPEEEEE